MQSCGKRRSKRKSYQQHQQFLKRVRRSLAFGSEVSSSLEDESSTSDVDWNENLIEIEN